MTSSGVAKVRIAVAGLGAFGSKHLEALARIAGAQIAALVDSGRKPRPPRRHPRGHRNGRQRRQHQRPQQAPATP